MRFVFQFNHGVRRKECSFPNLKKKKKSLVSCWPYLIADQVIGITVRSKVDDNVAEFKEKS